ncbi:ALA-interacting subunit like [Actinidia chinensis var. chinensis]|uniref:ALA-interacting subunit like n=1 Tax=Actinidia chinensis var. chinensis TaxID=1590841 RepID=A0A2R6RJ96_ACTCC|nr:ALA-interacting subunit like [Actinidia chinensis var. chinensis]
MDLGAPMEPLNHPLPLQSSIPRNPNFTEQELPACEPILTHGWVITAVVSVGVIFIPIGLPCSSEHVVEIVDCYDKDCVLSTYSMIRLHTSKAPKLTRTVSGV